jgi:hypothetical protein
MQGTESGAPLAFTPLVVTAVQSPYWPFPAPTERESYRFPAEAERPSLRREVISLEHWLDLNA